MYRVLLIAMTLLAPAISWAGEPTLPPQNEILKRLYPEHPRLLARRADFQQLAAQCQRDARAARWLSRLSDRAEKLIEESPVKYEIPDGKRLLAVSREAKDRVLLLGLLYQLSGERKYVDRAWTELSTVAEFKDWNPSHFLDTAEMTFAVAIGYDWFYHAWNEEQRVALRAAILEKGLQPGLTVYRNQQWWAKCTHNWNQVCNGGLAIGALAIADKEPKLAGEVLHSALKSLPLAMHEFAPDGGWGEGPGYWRYATEYNVYLLAALQTALDSDFGLSKLDGFAHTGDFALHTVGPAGKCFNFGDAHEGWHGATQLFWLAEQFGNATYAEAQLPFADERTSPLDLLWGAKWTTRRHEAEDPHLAHHFQGISVGTLRSAWKDPRATFVAFKGGDNRVNHGHLDLGSFVLEALGERWAVDLGPDDYNLPGYFGKQRWTYVRNNTQSHNTLVIARQNQAPSARAKIVRFAPGDEWMGGVVDLSAAWPQANRVWRGVAMLDHRQVLIQDEVVAEKPVDVRWQMLTDAQIEILGQTAVLTKNNQRIKATLLAPKSARWQAVEVELPRPQRPAAGVRSLVASTAEEHTDVCYAIVFDATLDAAFTPAIQPLMKWPAAPE